VANVTVGITVRDHNDNTVDDVSISVFSRSTLALLDTQLSGSSGSGRAEFTLSGSATGTVYLMRACQFGVTSLYSPVVSIDQRGQFEVFDPPLPELNYENEVTVYLPDPEVGRAATDPDLCRCHFRVMRFDKVPLPNYHVRIRHAYDPETYHGGEDAPLEGGLIASDVMTLFTDKNGYASVDLFRGGRYEAWLPIRAEKSVMFAVPDEAEADLVNLIWLYPREAVYDDTPLSLAVGDVSLVEVTEMVMSNLRSTDLADTPYTPSGYTDVYTTDSDVVSVSWSGNFIRIEALQAGTCEVSLVAQDYRALGIPIRNPQPLLLQSPIQVTVT
jgi:hypothetical protein